LDALPSHLITPFNGSIPPPNLLDKIARGITAAKGPNDWPHSVTATRAKLLDLARARAMEERRKSIIDEDVIFLSGNVHRPADLSKCAERNDTSPDVLQPTTNTPKRHPLYRQSSMDFMTDAKVDHNESIARYVPPSVLSPYLMIHSLSHRLQRHEHTFHHPYLRPTHLRRPMEHSLAPSTPSSSTLNASQSNIRKSTASSNSNSTFGTPVSASAPLRPSSLRRSSTLTLASSCDMRVDPEGDGENLFKTAEFRRSGGYSSAAIVGVKVKKVPTQSATPRTPSTKNVITPYSKTKPKVPALSVISSPKTPPSKPRVLPTTTIKAATPIKQPKFRKGHMPSLSVSSDEEEKARSQRAKKPRTREPSWSLNASSDVHRQQTLPVLASTQITTTSSMHKDLTRKRESGRSAFSLPEASSSSSDNDNEFSTASVETAATTVSLSTPALPVSVPKAKPKAKEKEEPKTTTTKPKPIRRNLVRNPSMFGPELPCPQATPSPPSRIPLSSPIGSPVAVSLASPVNASPSTPLLATQTRPRTLRHAARRISFGSLRAASPVLSGESGMVALGSAFQLA
jgi:hypothetical protein